MFHVDVLLAGLVLVLSTVRDLRGFASDDAFVFDWFRTGIILFSSANGVKV